MQLKSLKTEGIIKYDHILPSAEEELALSLDEDVNDVKMAVNALINMGVIEKWENDNLYLVAMQELIGSETANAERVRKHRELHSKEKLMLQCNTDVTKCNIEIEKEIDKNIYVQNFDDFFEKYPRKQSKAKTEDYFIKNKIDDETYKPIEQGLQRHLKYWKQEKTDKKFIPLPTTWLNQKRWLDELNVQEEKEHHVDNSDLEERYDSL